MADDTNVADFESIYAAAEQTEGVIPHDIGGPQPVVEQLVAYGALRGEVFDPGTGDGHRGRDLSRSQAWCAGRVV